jgi:hypothetical protein
MTLGAEHHVREVPHAAGRIGQAGGSTRGGIAHDRIAAARRRGRIGGRPKALDEADLKKARALLRSGDYTKVQVAEELEVSRHTLWRALSHEAK